MLSIVRWGTGRYPETVARRLKAVNVAAWLIAAISAVFATMRFLHPMPGLWKAAAVNAAAAVVFLAMPLLHRFGELVGPLAFLVIAYAYTFWIVFTLGTGGGAYLYFLTFSTLGVLFLGTERRLLIGGSGAVAAGLVLTLRLIAPRTTGLIPETQFFFVNFGINVAANTAILIAVVHYAVGQGARAEVMAKKERERSESLLANILPPRVAERLKHRADTVIADAYPEASILFADMAGFTARASDTAPEELVRFLNGVYTILDSLVERHGLEKIKTTGDAYMVVSGVPAPRPDHAEALAELALEMRDSLAGLVDSRGRAVPVRIGIASGPVVAGVIGTRKFFYDVWGDAVNTAARMESTGVTGRIQVAPETRERLKDRFELEARGKIYVRGKGPMPTWFLIGRPGNHSRAEHIA